MTRSYIREVCRYVHVYKGNPGLFVRGSKARVAICLLGLLACESLNAGALADVLVPSNTNAETQSGVQTLTVTFILFCLGLKKMRVMK